MTVGWWRMIRLCAGRVDSRFYTLALMALLVAGCGSTGNKDQTLESLESKQVVVQPQSLPQASEAEARKSYVEFLNSTHNEKLKARALERLTDLQLEQKQNQNDKVVNKSLNQAFEPQTSVRRMPEEQAQNTTTQTQNQTTSPEKSQTASNGKSPANLDETNDLDFAPGDYLQVARQYEALLKRHPHSKDNERILYQLARAYDLGGKPKKSLHMLTRLVKEFPGTKKLEEAEFRRGEILFSLKSFSKAVAAYRVVLNNPKSEFYERALYKHGWSLFKSNRLNKALKSFYSLLDYHFKAGAKFEDFSRSEKEILNDTFRVISLTYSYAKGARSIKDFSKANGRRSYEYLIYQHLAQLYLKQQRVEDAAKTYLAYVGRFPNSSEAPGFYLKVITIYAKGGFPTLLTKAKAEFVNNYGIGKSYWENQSQDLLDKITPELKSNLKDLAAHYHAVGQKSKNAKDFKVAAYWYGDYVRSFPKDPDSANMNFLLAEVLQESGDIAKSADEFEHTAYNYPPFEKSAEAGYAAILARQQLLTGLKGQELTDKRREAITSSLSFADHFPQDSRVPAVLMKVADEFMDLKQYQDAATVAGRLTQLKAPNVAKLQIKAWVILATAEFELGNYKESEEASIQRLRAVDPNNDPDRKDNIERLAAAIYKQGEAAKTAGKPEQAADDFLRIATLAPTSSIRVSAEYDAAVVLAQAQLWEKAIPVLKQFVRLYPNHKFSKNAVETLALAYEKTGNLTSAAATYVEIYNREKDPEKRRDLVWQTAETYEKANQKDKAIDVYQQYVKLFPKPLEQAMEARIRIADYYLQTKKIALRRQWLQEIVKADAAGQSTDRTKFLAAKATLELAEPRYREYQQVKLVLPLKPNLKKKKALMEKCIKSYTRAANYGVAEVTTEATYRIAEIYRGFSKGLYDSERPKGLAGDELEQYNLLLEEQAEPFDEKAISIHEANASRTSEGVYDEWVKKSFAALKKLEPFRYAKNERSESVLQAIN